MESRGGGSAGVSSSEWQFLDHTFRIGEESGPVLRQGLNAETAQKTAEIIRDIAAVDAVAITDHETILGYTGAGCPYMVRGQPILTDLTRRALRTGRVQVAQSKEDLSCPVGGCPCPLHTAVIAPLRVRDRIAGTVKLYRHAARTVPSADQRLAVGIAQILSLQLEAGETDRLRELAARARLEALRAQIRPHFLFNALNTVLMFSRRDIDRARELLVQLASFLRRVLTVRGDFIRLDDELEYVQTYLDIERARFGDALQVRFRVEPAALGCLVPVLTLQPLVENAVVHGLAPREGGGKILVSCRVRGPHLTVLVVDNGMGVPPERKEELFRPGAGTGMGLGLANINERLVGLYGEAYGLKLRSGPGRGTAVRMRVPVHREPVPGALPAETPEAGGGPGSGAGRGPVSGAGRGLAGGAGRGPAGGASGSTPWAAWEGNLP